MWWRSWVHVVGRPFSRRPWSKTVEVYRLLQKGWVNCRKYLRYRLWVSLASWWLFAISVWEHVTCCPLSLTESGPTQANPVLCLERHKIGGPTLFKINKTKIFIMSDRGQNDVSQRVNKKVHLAFHSAQMFCWSWPPILCRQLPTCTSYFHAGITCKTPSSPGASVYCQSILHLHFIIPVTIRVQWFCVTIYCLPFHHDVRCIRIGVVSLSLVGIAPWLSSISCTWKLLKYLLKSEYCLKKRWIMLPRTAVGARDVKILKDTAFIFQKLCAPGVAISNGNLSLSASRRNPGWIKILWLSPPHFPNPTSFPPPESQRWHCN